MLVWSAGPNCPYHVLKIQMQLNIKVKWWYYKFFGLHFTSNWKHKPLASLILCNLIFTPLNEMILLGHICILLTAAWQFCWWSLYPTLLLDSDNCPDGYVYVIILSQLDLINAYPHHDHEVSRLSPQEQLMAKDFLFSQQRVQKAL